MTIVIYTRNVQQALPKALALLDMEGIWRPSRNGQVIQYPEPVVTDYERPWERVIFWNYRDANPFFHLYEALWMLAGRNDVASMVNFAKQMQQYSDDGETLHGAYGDRWINHFNGDPHNMTKNCAINQLDFIVDELQTNPDSRRAVLQMWCAECDLGRDGKDVPCNLTITFQVSHQRKLEMSVFCRSNDIIWGAYGANAVHFSMLQEYIAVRLGVEMGHYNQMSVNWHAYEEPFKKLVSLSRVSQDCLYTTGMVNTIPMTETSISNIDYILKTVDRTIPMTETSISNIDYILKTMDWIQEGGLKYLDEVKRLDIATDSWSQMVLTMMKAHYLFKVLPAPDRYTEPLLLVRNIRFTDWGNAAGAWLRRRMNNWEDRQQGE